MSRDPSPLQLHPRLSFGEQGFLALLAVVVVGFGLLVEVRGARLKRRMTDLQVFLRAAAAVRLGHSPYAATDDNGWHYHYPPLFAVLMTPLADLPPDEDRSLTVPFAVSVALWYAFSVGCLALSVHWLASSLEETSPDPLVRGRPPGCRAWWWLRLAPVLACLPPVGHTLMRGQVNLLLLLLLSGMIVSAARGQRGRAGVWLAGAICLKVIPALLLLYPLWRRDGRCLAGCAAGLFVGLVLVPAAVFGPFRTADYYREWTDAVIRPGLGGGEDRSRHRELTGVTSTASQSPMAAIHNVLHPDRYRRPAEVSAGVRRAHWAVGAALTALTLAAAGWRRDGDGRRAHLFLGALIVCMLLLSPVAHLHYFCLVLPLLTALLAHAGECGRLTSSGLWLLAAGNVMANVLPQLPGIERARDFGLVGVAALAVWLAGVILLSRRRTARGEERSAVGPMAA